MNHNNIVYIMAGVGLVSTFSLLLTRDNENIVKMAFIVSIIMSCFLMLVSELTIFISLIFFNFFIFFITSVAALKEPEKKSLQEPLEDIPTIVAILVIVGMVIISIFQNIDFLKVEQVIFFQPGGDDMIDFIGYTDLISVVFVVFISVVLFFNTRVLKK